jgi:hypothetical protein
LVAAFSASVLRCFGAATIEASTICPPMARYLASAVLADLLPGVKALKRCRPWPLRYPRFRLQLPNKPSTKPPTEPPSPTWAAPQPAGQPYGRGAWEGLVRPRHLGAA